MKNQKRSLLLPVSLGALVVTLMGAFVISGTLAKFTSTVNAQSGAVPAAQFLFNKEFNGDEFITEVWELESLGASANPEYSEMLFYPGSYGAFTMDVDLISDVPTRSIVEIVENKTGAFRDDVVYTVGEDTNPVRDLTSVRFVISDQEFDGGAAYEDVNFVGANSCNLSGFAAALDEALTLTLGENGIYDPGAAIDKTIYVYWDWSYEIDASRNVNDTLFGNYVSALQDAALFGAEAETSDYGIEVTMTVEQIPVAEY